MIRTEQVTGAPTFPLDELTDHSRKDLEVAGDLSGLAGAPATTFFYDDDKFLLAFTLRRPKNFLEPAEIYLVVGKAYGPKYARITRRMLKEMAARFIGLRTIIDVGFRPGCRFAEFLGFRPRGEPFELINRRFQIYEVY